MREKNIENLRTEKEGLIVLSQLIDNLIIPTKEQIIFLYELLNIDYKKYFKSIDAIALKVKTFDLIKTKNDFFLLEVKTTKAKNVKTLPYGVFFGFTKNEEDLFKSHDNYRLCIVHTILKEHIFLTYKEYLALIKNKRTQYQINFKSKK
jgi:hypothetical protein